MSNLLHWCDAVGYGAPMRTLLFCLALVLSASSFPAGAQTAVPAVEDAWIMTPPPGATEAAAYLTLRNVGGDRLLSVSCDCAARADLHNMSVVDGVMQMRPLRYGIAADNGVVVLSPSGAHIMLVGLAESLRDGDRVRLRLTMQNTGVLSAEAVVRHLGGHQHH